MYVPSNKELAHQLRMATHLVHNKVIVELLMDTAERIEDLDKIAEHYRAKAEEELIRCQQEIKN